MIIFKFAKTSCFMFQSSHRGMEISLQRNLYVQFDVFFWAFTQWKIKVYTILSYLLAFIEHFNDIGDLKQRRRRRQHRKTTGLMRINNRSARAF